MKPFGLISLLILLVLSSTECWAGEIVSADGYSGPTTTIRYSMWGGALELQNAKTICKDFVTQNPDIKVDVSVYPWGQYWQKLQTQTASGLAPDVMSMTSSYLGIWSDRGALKPLNPDLVSSAVKLSDYRKVAVDNCTWNGTLYSFPIEIPATALVYNVDKLEQAGIPQSDWPSPDHALTWAQFQSLCRRLTLRRTDGSFAQYGMAASSTDVNNSFAASLYGARVYDRQVNPTSAHIVGNNPLIEGWEDVYKSEYANRYLMPPLAFSSSSNGQSSPSGALASQYAMCTGGSWDIRSLQQSGLHYGLGVLPQGPYPYTEVGTNSVAIFSGSTHPKEAWAFVRFLGSASSERILGRSLKGIPALIEAQDAVVNNDYNVPGCQAFTNGLSVGVPAAIVSDDQISVPLTSWMQRLEQTIEEEYDTRYRQMALSGKPIDDQTYAAFVSGMDTYIDQAVPASLTQFDDEQKEAFVLASPRHYGFFTRVVGPILFLLAIVLAGIFYFAWMRKNNTPQGFENRKGSAVGLGFISPWLTGLLAFGIGPVLASVLLSFTDWNMIKPPHWIGLGNYVSLWGDPYFEIGLKRTFLYAAVSIPISVMGGLITAGLLSAKIKGGDVFKSIIYFPALFTGAEASVLWLNIYNKDHGVLNRLLLFLHMAPIDWLDEAHIFWSVILMSSFWIGGAMIICYAGMKQIPITLYEAAEIEGANFMQQFFKVTVPLLSPVILFLVIVGTIGAFQVFTPALFFSGGASTIGQPGDALRYYSVLIYSEAFNSMHMGKACCLALILFAIIFVVTMGQMAVSRRFVYTDVD